MTPHVTMTSRMNDERQMRNSLWRMWFNVVPLPVTGDAIFQLLMVGPDVWHGAYLVEFLSPRARA